MQTDVHRFQAYKVQNKLKLFRNKTTFSKLFWIGHGHGHGHGHYGHGHGHGHWWLTSNHSMNTPKLMEKQNQIKRSV